MNSYLPPKSKSIPALPSTNFLKDGNILENVVRILAQLTSVEKYDNTATILSAIAPTTTVLRALLEYQLSVVQDPSMFYREESLFNSVCKNTIFDETRILYKDIIRPFFRECAQSKDISQITIDPDRRTKKSLSRKRSIKLLTTLSIDLVERITTIHTRMLQNIGVIMRCIFDTCKSVGVGIIKSRNIASSFVWLRCICPLFMVKTEGKYDITRAKVLIAKIIQQIANNTIPNEKYVLDLYRNVVEPLSTRVNKFSREIILSHRRLRYSPQPVDISECDARFFYSTILQTINSNMGAGESTDLMALMKITEDLQNHILKYRSPLDDCFWDDGVMDLQSRIQSFKILFAVMKK